MKGLDDGPDGLNDKVWERATDQLPGRRKIRAARAARAQSIPVVQDAPHADASSAPRELPPITVPSSDVSRLIRQREQRVAKVEDLDRWFDATAELRCSPPLFESDEPGARDALVAWATRRGFRIEDERLDVIGGRHNMVTRAHTAHHHHIDVLWTERAEEVR